MGKGNRLRAQRAVRQVWSVTDVSRQALRWRAELLTWLNDKALFHHQQSADHLDRLRHAGDLMRQHAEDPTDTFEVAWMSFTRPLIRLGFASGLDVSEVRWHTADPHHLDPDAVGRFVSDAVEADRQCDQAAISGPVYVVSPEIHAVIAACAATLSFRECGEAFRDDELPAVAGMIVLPDRAPWVAFPHTRALTWQRLPEVRWGEDPKHAVPTMRMKAYAHSSIYRQLRVAGTRIGVTNPDSLIFNGRRDIEPCLGDLEPLQADDLEQFLHRAAGERLQEQDFYGTIDEHSRQAGLPVGEVRLDEREDSDPMTLGRYVAAFVRVIDQDIVTPEQTDKDQATYGSPRRHAEPTEQDIQILRLRRAATGTTGEPIAPGRWSHRWVVQMHKVRQWYPSLNRHKTIWRGPYIKGPAGAPLKAPKERVHAVIH